VRAGVIEYISQWPVAQHNARRTEEESLRNETAESADIEAERTLLEGVDVGLESGLGAKARPGHSKVREET